MTGTVAILTRPEGVDDGMAEVLYDLGVKTVHAPMTRIVPFSVSESIDYAAHTLIFTSANAVRSFVVASPVRQSLVLTVGDETARIARACGFSRVVSGGGTVKDLIRYILSRPAGCEEKEKPMIHLCGRDLVAPLVETLSSYRLNISAIEVYSADLVEEMPGAILPLFGGQESPFVLFFSARAAGNFERLLRQETRSMGNCDHLKPRALCLSRRVEEALDPEMWSQIQAADRPDRSGMLDLVRRFCCPPCVGDIPAA